MTQDKKQKHNFEVALNNEYSWFKPSNCERFDKNLLLRCHANADFSCPPHGHGQEQREQFVLWQPEHSVCFFRVWHVRVFGTYCLFLRVLASFPDCYGPKRALCMCESHVESLHLCCAGVTVYKGELFPLWSALSSRSAVIGLQSLSCIVVGWSAVSWIPPSTTSMWLCLHWVQSSMFCWKTEIFPQMSLLPPHCLLKLIFY